MIVKKSNNTFTKRPEEEKIGTREVCAFNFLHSTEKSTNYYHIGTYRQGIFLGGVALFAE